MSNMNVIELAWHSAYHGGYNFYLINTGLISLFSICKRACINEFSITQ